MLRVYIIHLEKTAMEIPADCGDHRSLIRMRIRLNQEGLQLERIHSEGLDPEVLHPEYLRELNVPQVGQQWEGRVSRERTRVRTAHANFKCADALFYSDKLLVVHN